MNYIVRKRYNGCTVSPAPVDKEKAETECLKVKGEFSHCYAGRLTFCYIRDSYFDLMMVSPLELRISYTLSTMNVCMPRQGRAPK